MKKITLLLSFVVCVAFTQAQTLLSETFGTSIGNFTIVDVTLPEGGTYVWKWDSNKYMKASAYISGSNKASESWVISPVINLTNISNAALTFDHTGKYFTANKLTEQEVYVSTNYSSGAVSTATWTKLTIPTWPSGTDWTFVNSGPISLSSVNGQSNVRIAFKYASTTSGAATWEFKNFIISTSTGFNQLSNSEFKAIVSGSDLVIKNVANGSTVEIFSALGNKVQTSVLENGKIELNNLQKGMYVVRVGKQTQKIML